MSTFPINFKKRPAHVTFPIKSSELRSGYSAAETFFLNAGVEASLARKLALRCVSNYRRAAGATGARREAMGIPANAFAPATMSRMLRSEGVL